MIDKMVCGVGINDLDNAWGKKFYNSWKRMLQRCYSPNVQSRQPTYIGCTVSEEWHTLSTFKNWFDENHVEGWHLDKDVLFPRNKIYSSDCCMFLPRKINGLFNFNSSKRGEFPLGVYYSNKQNSYISYCCYGSGKSTGKSFNNPTDAHFWYLEKKISVIESYLDEDYNDRIKQGLRNWRGLLQEHLDNGIEFIP